MGQQEHAPGGTDGDPGHRDELARAVHRITRRYCRARLGRSRTGYTEADELAGRIGAAVLRDHRDELGGPAPVAAVVYPEMAAAVARAASARAAAVRWSRLPSGGLVTRPDGPDEPDAVLAGLDDLPPDAREVLVLRALVGLSRDQVAAVLGLSAQEVAREQQRALALLRAR